MSVSPAKISFTIVIGTVASIGLAKKCLLFLSKNKRHIFHFYQELYCTTYSPFFPLPSAIFQATS